MKTALVLSGGGAKGSFQAGVVTKLVEKGITFDCIAGVSVGCLNGSAYAQNEPDTVVKFWQTVTEKDVFIKPNYLQIAYNNIFGGKKSIYDASPLLKLIQSVVSLEKSKIPFYIGLTSLVDGKYHSLTQTDFSNNNDYQQAIYASSLMPILWEPVNNVITRTANIQQAVDGGLRNITPIRDIIKERPDIIYVVNCNIINEISESIPKNIINVITRTFTEIMLNEILDNDINGILLVNKLIYQANKYGCTLINDKTGQPYKYFEIHYIQPPYKLSSSIDFSRSNLDANFKLGYNYKS